ncbi:hypothetical protein [Limnobacter sp.]|uniref:hypothetical protein n=1 Tax=Limnobacter sp. TaxID=2003368 RepID=UPI0039C99F95
MKKIHITAYGSTVVAHGGTKRSAQVREIASENGYETYEFEGLRKYSIKAIKNPMKLLHSILVTLKYMRHDLTMSGLFCSIVYGVELLKVLEKEKDVKCIIEIAAGKNLLLANFLRVRGISYDIYPHNIEFLVPNQVQSYFKNLSSVFKTELAIFKMATSIHTISDLDATIIKCLGLDDVDVVPYSPVGPYLDELIYIKNNRVNSIKKDIMIIGSVSNPPTRKGLSELIKEIEKFGKRKYFLVGVGTECFKSQESAKLTILGTVTSDVLKEKMSSCSAILIKQPQTTGILTRMIEASIAGIPIYILGDYAQAKASGLKEVKLVSSIDEFENKVSN